MKRAFGIFALFALGAGFSLAYAGSNTVQPELVLAQKSAAVTGREVKQSPSILVQEQAEPKVEEFSGPVMTFERLVEIARAIDPDVQVQNRGMRLTVQEIPITIVADVDANRMRAFVPFKNLDGVDGQTLYRMMQANFDSALDARYAIAQGHLISAFIHPLAELEKDQFIEGLGQVANLVLTYGNAYTSGAMTFGGGDSRNLHRKLIDDLLKKGEQI